MVMKLALWHCPTAIHLSTACQPAYVCNCPPPQHPPLPLNPPPSLTSPQSPVQIPPHTTHTHTHTHTHTQVSPSSPCLSFSLSSRPSLQVWAFKTGAVINLWASTVTSDQTTYTHTTKHTRIDAHFLSFSVSFLLSFFHLPSRCLSLCHPTSPSLCLFLSLPSPPSSASSRTLAQICST